MLRVLHGYENLLRCNSHSRQLPVESVPEWFSSQSPRCVLTTTVRFRMFSSPSPPLFVVVHVRAACWCTAVLFSALVLSELGILKLESSSSHFYVKFFGDKLRYVSMLAVCMAKISLREILL